MLKVKVFRFEVSNWSLSPMDSDLKTSSFMQSQLRIISEEEIERELNYFMEDKEISSVDVKTIDVSYHNNGRANTIHLLYTIIYKEI